MPSSTRDAALPSECALAGMHSQRDRDKELGPDPVCPSLQSCIQWTHALDRDAHHCTLNYCGSFFVHS